MTIIDAMVSERFKEGQGCARINTASSPGYQEKRPPVQTIITNDKYTITLLSALSLSLSLSLLNKNRLN